MEVRPETGDPLRIGRQVTYLDQEYVVVALMGGTVYLRDQLGELCGLLRSEFLSQAVPLDPAAPAIPQGSGTLWHSEGPVAMQARFWEEHILEVMRGVPVEGSTPRPEYDPERTTQEQRIAAKSAELQAQGLRASKRTLERRIAHYKAEGIVGMVDGRAVRTTRRHSVADELILIAYELLEARGLRTTICTNSLVQRLRVEASHRHPEIAVPSNRTLIRLFNDLDRGGLVLGSASRRQNELSRSRNGHRGIVEIIPGSRFEIDSTKFDTAVRLPNGATLRPFLTTATDAATGTTWGVFTPGDPIDQDIVHLLLKAMTPMSDWPHWGDFVQEVAAGLPEGDSGRLDELRRAADEMPCISPLFVRSDLGKVFESDLMKRYLRMIKASRAPTQPASPSQKPFVESRYNRIASRFAQLFEGYLGRNTEMRGFKVEEEAELTLQELQALFDLWVAEIYQNDHHRGLQSRFGTAHVTPNIVFREESQAFPSLAIPITPAQRLELLPMETRAVNHYGVNFQNRTYDGRVLDGPPSMRQVRIGGKRTRSKRWEIRYDRDDVRRIWIRIEDGSLHELEWIHAHILDAPMASAIYEEVARVAGGTERLSEQAAALRYDVFLSDAEASRKGRAARLAAKQAERQRINAAHPFPLQSEELPHVQPEIEFDEDDEPTAPFTPFNFEEFNR